MHQYDIDAQYQDQSKELNLKNKNVKKAELIAPTFPHFGPIWKKWLSNIEYFVSVTFPKLH